MPVEINFSDSKYQNIISGAYQPTKARLFKSDVVVRSPSIPLPSKMDATSFRLAALLVIVIGLVLIPCPVDVPYMRGIAAVSSCADGVEPLAQSTEEYRKDYI